MWSNGYTGTGSTVGNKHSILPTSVLHLWADPRRIIIHGLDGSSRKILITHMESAETPSTTGRSLPPVAVWCNVETGFNMNNQHELVSYRGDTAALGMTNQLVLILSALLDQLTVIIRGKKV